MAPKYIALPHKPRADWADDPLVADVSTRTIILDDDAPVKTGLLDQTGTPIYRVANKIPVGFVKS